MGTPAFDTHALICPHCAQPSRSLPDEPINGLYTCPNCKTRFVVCWSGHCVRDPATAPRSLAGSLRRQPLTRVLRDVGLGPIVGLLGTIAVGGLVLASGLGLLPEHPSRNYPSPVSLLELLPSEVIDRDRLD